MGLFGHQQQGCLKLLFLQFGKKSPLPSALRTSMGEAGTRQSCKKRKGWLKWWTVNKSGRPAHHPAVRKRPKMLRKSTECHTHKALTLSQHRYSKKQGRTFFFFFFKLLNEKIAWQRKSNLEKQKAGEASSFQIPAQATNTQTSTEEEQNSVHHWENQPQCTEGAQSLQAALQTPRKSYQDFISLLQLKIFGPGSSPLKPLINGECNGLRWNPRDPAGLSTGQCLPRLLSSPVQEGQFGCGVVSAPCIRGFHINGSSQLQIESTRKNLIYVHIENVQGLGI